MEWTAKNSILLKFNKTEFDFIIQKLPVANAFLLKHNWSIDDQMSEIYSLEVF